MISFHSSVTPIPLPDADQRRNGFAVYQSLLENHAAERMFLLESLGTDSVDACSTLIGLDPSLWLTVRGCKARIEGDPALLAAVGTVLQRYRGGPAGADRLEYVLERRADIWDFLRQFETAFAVHKAPGAAELALFGYLGYETIRYIEAIPRHQQPLDTPEIALTLYRTVITLDDHSASLTHYSFEREERFDAAALAQLCRRAAGSAVPAPALDEQPYTVQFETCKAAYLEKCRRALSHIRLGDVYQIQIGQKLRVASDMPPLALYARLRQLNPSPYMYFFTVEGRTVVGASPELFIRTHGQDNLVMRPIAGTVGKFGGRSREQALRELHGSEKEVAEHLMLVDLCRNDLCRVCEPESLLVEDLMDIEEYSHVFHMVTSTSARMRPECDKYDAICASFPAGTMTGTPKVRALELIEEIEDSCRGHYAGIVGMLGIGSNFLNTALCIRSAVREDGAYTLRASAGVVSDSMPESEYRETLHKLGSVFMALTGKELTCVAE